MPKQPANPFSNYVQERLQLIAINEDEAKQDQTKQSVTVRLNPGQVRLLDTLAKNLEHSRQALLLELITTGANHVAMAYADGFGDKAQEVYRELMEVTSFREGDFQ